MTHSTWHIPDPISQPEFYADVPTKRLIAWTVDATIVLLLSFLAVVLTAFVGIFFFAFLMLAISFTYRVITISQASATLGMRLTAIEFRTSEGEKFDTSMAFAHTFGYVISWSVPVLQLISVILMLNSPRRQGLSDHVLSTVAVNRRARS